MARSACVCAKAGSMVVWKSASRHPRCTSSSRCSQYRAPGCEPGQGLVTIGAWGPAAETGEVPGSQEAYTQETSAGALIGRFNSHSNRCDHPNPRCLRPDLWRHAHLLGQRHQADPRGQRRQAWGVARRQPSYTRGPAPDVGRTSRSPLCVLRRKRRQRPARTGRSQPMGRRV